MDRMPIVQGDVMLFPVDAIPDGQKRSGKVHVLALGEVTGHSHVLDRAVLVEAGGERYVSVESGSALRHEDHGTVVVPSGAYRVIQQQEPDLMDEFRAVMD